MSARSQILSRIRSALGDGLPTDPVVREYRRTSDVAAGSPQAVEILVDRLEDYKAHVHQVATEAGLPAVVAEILTSVEASSVVVPAGLPEQWLSALTDMVTVHADSRATAMPALALDEVDAVVTAARVAVADTGTIVLDGEPDQGRRAITLVPDVHVCVVRTAQVVHTVPEGVTILAEHPQRPQTWISGPSATSDIELSRVEGVHGPRTLHVVLVG